MPLDDDLIKLIRETAKNLNISIEFVEKDFYVFQFLKRLFAEKNPLVFKGGTSLSMCYGAIRRFSEDVDLSYSEGPISRGGKRKAKESILEAIRDVGLILNNPGQQRSRRLLNRFICSFRSEGAEGQPIKLLIELAAQTPSFPVERRTIQSMVGMKLQSEGRLDLVRHFELEPIEVRTHSLIRTFSDKIFAVCDYFLLKRTYRLSRHIYDLHCLLEYVPLDEAFLDLFRRIALLRSRLDYCPSSKEGVVISSCLKEIGDTRYYENDFDLLTTTLLYERVSYNTCIKAVYLIADFLKKHGL